MPDIGPVELIIICVIAAIIGSAFWRGSQSRASGGAGAVQPWGSGVGPPPGQYGSVMPASSLPPVLTRTYRGKPHEVEDLRSVDAEALAKRGYFPSSLSYAPGEWSGGAWVLAVVLILLFGLGLLVLIYMVAVKPAGSLTVFYERRTEPGIAPAVAASPLPPQVVYPATLPGTGVPPGPEGPPQPPGGVIRLGLWEVVESASALDRRGARVSVRVEARVLAVAGPSILTGIPLEDAVVEIEDGRLCLSDGLARRFELVPTEGQDLGRALEAIRERQAPGQRRELSVAPAVVATQAIPALPPASDSPAPPGPDSPAERIEARLATLKRLRATGSISEEEYQARRNKILDEV